MFDIAGHSIKVRAPHRPRPAEHFPGDVEPHGLKHDDVMVVVIGEDLGQCLLLAYNHDGQRVFEDRNTPGASLNLYDLAAKSICEGLRLEQVNAQIESRS